MVTGAAGFVAGWLVKKLLEQGLTVHATVRDPLNTSKVSHLLSIAENSTGTLKLFKADLMQPGSFNEAMQGCELVFHTASPFVLEVKDPQRDLINPAVMGTANVLDAASQSGSVKRVVLTSSCASIFGDNIECAQAPNGMLNESIWNTTSSLKYMPYSYSKTMAERKAWELAEKQSQWDLVTINPSFVMGPALNPQATVSESITVLKQMADGTMRVGAPRLGVGAVDVRDVADAHIAAGFNPAAQGRYITSGHNTDMLALASTLRPRFGKRYPLPRNAVPKWLLLLVGPLVNKVLSREYVRKNVDVAWMADNSKIKRELGIAFTPLDKTMNDGFQSAIDAGLF